MTEGGQAEETLSMMQALTRSGLFSVGDANQNLIWLPSSVAGANFETLT